jgi:hypothetical protein
MCGDIIPEYCDLCDTCFILEEEEDMEDWEREYYEEF